MLTKIFKRLAFVPITIGWLFGVSLPAAVADDDIMDIVKALVRTIAPVGNPHSDGQFPPTHEQTRLIEVLPKDDPQGRQLVCFCLRGDGNLMAAITADPGEIRILSSQGQLVDMWSLPIRPEAINLDPDGTVLVAGQGKLLRLSPTGEVLRQCESPHMAFQENSDALRKEVLRQHELTSQSLKRQIDSLTQQVRRLKNMTPQQQQELTLLQAAIDQIADQREGDLTDNQREAVRLRRELVRVITRTLEDGISPQNRARIRLLERQIVQLEKFLKLRGNTKPTPEQIDKLVEQLRQNRSRISSISASGDDIFVATNAAKGYGYDVWRLTASFEEPRTVVTGLRGCCGQMDVQANENGVFVAENSRHRVCRYDREGNVITHWGERARSGVRGFGGCCNPMNLAFGKDGSVYTAESSSGRIMRFSADGEVREQIGSVKLVPGCKKVSIAVSEDGHSVYMLDITRNHIIVMEPRAQETPTSGPETQPEVAATAN